MLEITLHVSRFWAGFGLGILAALGALLIWGAWLNRSRRRR